VINTNPARLRSGQVWFQVEIGNTSNSGNVDLYDVSPLKFEFDLKSAESTINSVAISPGSITAVVNDDKPNGSSVFEALSGELGNFLAPFIPTRNANMFLLRYGQSTPDRFPLQLQFSGVKTDIKSGKTTLSFIPPFQTSENVKTFYQNVPEQERVFRVSNTNYFCKPMGDVIKSFINVDKGAQTIYDTGTDPVIGGSNGYHTSNMLNTGTFDNAIVYAFVNTNSINSQTWTNDAMLGKVVSAAASEGAIFGSAFSVNFYVNRRRTDKNTSLSNGDITELEYDLSDRQVNGINVFLNTQTYSSGFQAMPTSPRASSEIFSNPIGSQYIKLDLQAHAPQLNRGEFRLFGNTTTRVVNADAVAFDFTTGLLVSAGTIAYAQAFSAYQATSIVPRIKTTVLGVDKVKPHQSIKFDSTAPARFQNKHFRPSSLSYDFKADTIAITAYEII
jgi:hypothetical protein